MIKMMRSVSLFALAGAALLAQTFNSGSNGSDGALSLTTPGTIDFDPVALGKDTDGDNVFHFITINIGTGVIVRLKNGLLRGKPVVWLASGAVTITGTLDLSGQSGYAANSTLVSRLPAEPGPGGYPGGLGAYGAAQPSVGFGPGAMAGFCGTYGGSAGHAVTGGCGGAAYGNGALVPLRGGSGGGGGPSDRSGGGGGGGGAIRIASSATITVSGSILANGGDGGGGGPSAAPAAPEAVRAAGRFTSSPTRSPDLAL